jgi:hypothetical protein
VRDDEPVLCDDRIENPESRKRHDGCKVHAQCRVERRKFRVLPRTAVGEDDGERFDFGEGGVERRSAGLFELVVAIKQLRCDRVPQTCAHYWRLMY